MSTAPQPKRGQPDPLSTEALQAFDTVNGGVHPGFRPAHAKGVLLAGTFTPSPAAHSLTSAPHIHRPSIRAAVRFSDFAGVPNVPDFDPQGASPRGCAIRFYLEDHVHTDIIPHSVEGFPVRTAEEFIEFLHALAASGPGAPHPSPIEAFLGSHPAALAFVQAPKPIPTSFANESFYSVNAYKFTNNDGVSRFGRYRVVPQDGNSYLDQATASKQSADFLFDEMRDRLSRSPFKMRILVQLAADDDVVDDCTVQWPAGRPLVEFGAVEISAVVPDNVVEQRKIIFDPLPRVQGIEPSADPLLDPRANLYLLSGRRRRSAS